MAKKFPLDRLSFVLMDLDRFKAINDEHGHFIGDKVLIHFAHTIQTFLRKSDLFGRIGGEEFAIFLPDTDIDGAFQLADKLRDAIAGSSLEIDGKTITYTVSLGVSSSAAKDTRTSRTGKKLRKSPVCKRQCRGNGHGKNRVLMMFWKVVVCTLGHHAPIGREIRP